MNNRGQNYRNLLLAGTATISLQVLLHLPCAAETTINFKPESGKEKFSITNNGNRGSFDTTSQKTTFFDKGNNKLEINTTKGLIGYIRHKTPESWKIEDPAQQKKYVLKKEEDGHYKLKSGDEKELYKVKPETYGFKVEDATGKLLYRVMKQPDGTILKNDKDKIVFSTNSAISPVAMACLGFDSLQQEEKFALAYAVNFLGN